MDNSESFLPRIACVFYAIFDPDHGPKIVYQVPEDSISSAPSAPRSAALSPAYYAPTGDRLAEGEHSSLHPYAPLRFTSHLQSSHSPSPASNRASMSSSTSALFEFDAISDYVIPKAELCGKLVLCNTPRHRILGFPVLLRGYGYKRNGFRYNLCFVFNRMADISCYEPIVRKCARVLMACEEESSFLSNPQSSQRLYPILEQLFEDLNSYSETSIPVDSFNSIELKIFPFFPNPPKVYDWQVPVALINLEKRMDSSWDLTMAKVCPHINGIRHVAKIAELADATLQLTRQCMEHLLFYQCIMMIDIFQFSNMYTLRPSIQWMADDLDVQEECAAYVTQAGHPLQSWPTLLHLYSRFKAGKTVDTWMEENGVSDSAIDIRRFVTFGVIKGFLRRVHRYPVLLPKASKSRKLQGSSEGVENETPPKGSLFMNPLAESLTGTPSIESLLKGGQSSTGTSFSPTTPTATNVFTQARASGSFTSSTTPPGNSFSPTMETPRMPTRRMSSATNVGEQSKYPEQLPALLDGSHHTDELCTMFNIGWQGLERYLAEIGGSPTDSEDPGRVRIIYR